MNFERLPSGKWRARIEKNGRRHSFTAATKREAERMAAAFLAEQEQERIHELNMTVGEAIDQYVETKVRVLSPSTVARYVSMAGRYYDMLRGIRIRDLTDQKAQLWMGSMAVKYSPKTCRNAAALLTSAVKLYCPEKKLSFTVPKPKRPDLATPSMADVQKLVGYFDGRDPEMMAAVLLGAFGPMRRGEICALRGRDVDHASCTVYVRKNLVPKPGGGYAEKGPKTVAGYRQFQLPREVMEKIPVAVKDERIISLMPHQVDHRFRVACRACGLEKTRFHDLRHFGASILHAWGVPDVYIMQRGGWESDHVMKRVYREALNDEQAKMSMLISERIAHEMPTKNEE